MALRAILAFAIAVFVCVSMMVGACGGASFVAAASEGGTCTPKLCPDLHLTCGTTDDGCGHSINCGTCAAPNICTDTNACVCVGLSCKDLDAECGTIDDGCGNQLACGDCPTGMTCGGGGDHKCGNMQCTKMTCGDLPSGSCGLLSDGCGGTILCSCPGNGTCGGAGTANQCGCTPKTCASRGWTCGTGQDGCGNMLSCGTCTDGGTCGSNNTCNCAPQKTCLSEGWTCGGFIDSCGATEVCGPSPMALGDADNLLCATNSLASYLYAFACVECTDGGGGGGNPDCSGAPGNTPPEPGLSCISEQFKSINGWCCKEAVLTMP